MFDFSQSADDGPRMLPSMYARPGQRVHVAMWPHDEQVCRSRMRMPRTSSSCGEWRQIVANDCEAAAFMQFARVPWAMEETDRLIAGDLRYDREPTLGFAEIELKGATNCPAPQPWLPPRKYLLQPQDQ